MSRFQKLITFGTLTLFPCLIITGCGGKATTEPSSAPGAASPAPTAIQGTWVTTQLGTMQKVTLTLGATTYKVLYLPDQYSGAISVTGDRIQFSGSTACDGTGAYLWSLAGNSLTFTAISTDECPGRTAVIAGYTYSKQ